MTIKDNFKEFTESIPKDVNVVVVTKYHTVDEAIEVYEAGARHFGENRVEGFLEKRKALPDDAKVHFIGTLQSRKVKDISAHLEYLHSLDRLSVAKMIQKHCEQVVECFIQVNVSGESSKHGLNPEDVSQFIEELKAYDKVQVIGLMTMAPNIDDKDELKTIFERLQNLNQTLAKHNDNNIQLKELSMGMSNDYSIAIDCGATYIRIGSKIMGQG